MISRARLAIFGPTATLAVLAVIVVLAEGCATTGRNLDDTPLAFVNGEPVTVQNLEDSFESTHQGHTAFLAGGGAVREFLRPTIDRRLLIQEAHRIGLDQDAGIRQGVDMLVAQRARDQLYKDEVSRPPEISEQAIQAAYLRMAVHYHLRHILTYTREEAEQAIARVRAGEAFGTVASQVSVSGTAGKGGDLGFVGWGQLDPTLEAEFEAMKPDEIRGPIETDQGWNVVLLEEKITLPEPPVLAKVQNRIKMILSQRALSRRSSEFYEQLKSRWKVRVFDTAFTERNLLGGADSPDAEQAKQIPAASAGARTINLADLKERFNPDAVRKLPWSFALKQIRGLLNEVIYASLLEQEALRRGYASRPEISKEAHKLEDALLLDRLVGAVIYPRIQVSDEEVKTFYDQNPKTFTEPEALRIQVIALETEADAEAVLQELRGGADFAALARSRSRDPGTAQVGGELGWVTKGKLDPAIDDVAFSLKTGEVGIGKSERVSFVLRLEERRPARVQDFALVKAKAQDLLLKQRRREETQRWITRLREASEIVIEDAAIQQAVAMYEEQVKQKAAKSRSSGPEAKKGEQGTGE
jgi:parvulin-like peptidyl-prolyl isomerase